MADDRTSPLGVPWRGIALAGGVLVVGLVAAGVLASRNPLRGGWQVVEGAPYTVVGATEARLGARVARHRVRGEGQGDGRLALSLSPRPVPAVTAAVTTTYIIDWPSVRTADGRALAPGALALGLPAGDPLPLLAVAHAPRRGPFESIDGRRCRRVDFRIGGRAFNQWWHRRPHYLPPGASASALEELEGQGTVWLDVDQRPCRLSARLSLSRLAGAQPGVAHVDWRYRWRGPAER